QQFTAARHHEGRAAAQGPGFLRRLARKALLIAARETCAILVERTQHAGRLLRRADGRAQIHQCLRAIAGARLLVASARLLVAGARLLVAGARLLVAGARLLVAGARLLVAGT